jgi:excisionase family DNA binding protein
MERLLDPKEVALILKVRPVTVYKWASRGILPCHRLGRLVRFKEDDVRAFVDRSRVGLSGSWSKDTPNIPES